jgi:tellurite resistance-related uncharacterized protein/hemerythrin-like domain-containing protein
MKRHPSLASLSRDHHHALVLAQSVMRDAPARLRQSLPADGDALVATLGDRFARELEPHFVVEERILVPRSREHGGELAEQARAVLAQHADLRARIAELGSGPELADQLDAFGDALERHVRFEERSWFVSLERELGADALAALTEQLRPLPMARIDGLELDDEGVWVAELDCGHRQHVRHEPPWQRRPWVTSEQGRREHLGTFIPCSWCRMPKLPADVSEYKRTKTFDRATTPAALLRRHDLREGVWGEIVVVEGRLLYVLEDESDLAFALTATRPGVVAPTRPHHVEPHDDARFYVRFLRAPGAGT